MTRISDSQIGLNLINYISNNRSVIDKLNKEISTGIAVSTPGDSSLAGTISQFQQSIDKADSYSNTINSVSSFLGIQENILDQANTLLVRGKEIAEQAANGTNDPTARAQMAAEAFQIRDHLASLANTTYQGKYVYNGLIDNTPPYSTTNYTTPSTGTPIQAYSYDSASVGSTSTKSVNLTDNLTITTNTPGNQLFDDAIEGMERLGRALAGYETLPASGHPDPTLGVAYSFPTDYARQTQAIKDAMDQLDTARQVKIAPERTDIAGRQERIKTAQSLLSLAKTSAQEALDKYQNTDTISAATELTQAQTALQASLTVSVKILNLNILQFI